MNLNVTIRFKASATKGPHFTSNDLFTLTTCLSVSEKSKIPSIFLYRKSCKQPMDAKIHN